MHELHIKTTGITLHTSAINVVKAFSYLVSENIGLHAEPLVLASPAS